MAWNWNDVWPHPEEEYFQYSVIGYYEDGRRYDYHYGNKWAGDMQHLINQADLNGWKKHFDEQTKVFTFEKHFKASSLFFLHPMPLRCMSPRKYLADS